MSIEILKKLTAVCNARNAENTKKCTSNAHNDITKKKIMSPEQCEV